MKNLYIVRTPLQLFNAYEAKERFYSTGFENELLIVYGTKNDLIIMRRMLIKLNGWASIHYQKFFGITKLFYAFSLANRYKKGEYSNLYTGMIYHIPLHLMNKVQADQNWLLDDGNEVRLIIKNLNEGIYFKKNRSKPYLCINQDAQVLKSLKLFTLYKDLETDYKITINDYRVFKEKVSKMEIKADTCLVIGSNLICTYIKTLDIYLDILRHIYKKVEQSVKYYVPHRYLDEHIQEEIKKIGYNIISYDTILELGQLDQGWKFEHYYSIRSTAIDTLSNLYAVEGNLIRLPQEYFVSPEKWHECNEIWANSKNVLDIF